MPMRVTAILIFLLFLWVGAPRAEVLTIDKVPPELTQLKQNYEAEKKQAVSPEQQVARQKKYEATRRDALNSPDFLRQRSVLEASRDAEMQKITARYQEGLDKLQKETLATIDQKYQRESADFESNALGQAQKNYLAEMEKLEKALIAKNDLAGALMVQSEKKKVMSATPGVEPVETKGAAAAPVVAKSEAKAPAPATAPQAQGGTTEASPLTYVSNTPGLAGSAGNVSNNVYSFNLNKVGEHSQLIFFAYGKGKTGTDTYGAVNLVSPDGKRTMVAEWSPKNLQASNFYGVQSAKDVKPIAADISKFVTAPGTYQVEFKYKDGNEALNIFQVEVRTW